MQEITISELAALFKTQSSTIRYYEEIGLIHSIGRKGLQRVFSKNVITTMQLIILGKKANFSLDELKQMLAVKEAPIAKDVLLKKAGDIDQYIQQLDVLRNGLRHVAQCNFENPLECPKFQKIMKIYGTNDQDFK
ncbi:MerR family transcriptional regulator [Acinetobacter sp. CFCC 10889]|uniref:MerR family transcriptional regulator n=1 Tax=Acinetobacter sp. CFCC 10889 TaxID=1775557 RepID=UPI000DCFE034|nr:MerR family transcriptional regulator [Acinetobacter sp. CFCC 10889]